MGKSSPSSCLKIIVCGSDAAEKDGVHSPEAKTSNDKRGWSFRKKSGRHRVLGNNVNSESTTITDKEAPQGGSIDFQAPVKSLNDEKPQLPKPVEQISESVGATETGNDSKTPVMVVASKDGLPQAESKVSQDEVALKTVSNETSAEDRMVDTGVAENDSFQTAAENKMADDVISENDSNETSDTSVASDSFVSKDESIKSDEPKISESAMASEDGLDANVTVDETAVIIIQSAMRRFLAQKISLQLKSAVKLQAVIRGHLVRRNAVETLQCMRAIVKVQTLVRARSSKSLVQKNRPNDAQFSTMKLLQNSFTRQLLDSTSKPKSLNIRCDPMKPNSSWSWLERWMSVSKSEAAKTVEPSAEPENEVKEMAIQADAEISSVTLLDATDTKFNAEEREKSLENEESHVIDEVDTVGSSSAPPSEEFMIEQSQLQNKEIVVEEVASFKPEAIATELAHIQAESSVEDIQPEDIKPDTPATEIKESKFSMKRSAPSDLNDEGQKFVYGSRKASNPAFIAAHSKFEELTTASIPGKATFSSNQDVEAESHIVSAPYPEESVKKATKLSDAETSGTFDPRIHVARSECGTEISVSSTLDSPDRSDIENAEAEGEVQFLEQTRFQPVVKEKQDYEDGIPIMIQQGEVHEINKAPVDSVVAKVDPHVEDKLEKNVCDVQTDFAPASSMTTMDSSPVEDNHQENGYDAHLEHESTTAYKSSPEASPIRRRTAQESQGTPSSQASVKDKRNKVDKRGSNRKRSSPSSAKRSPSNPNVDSGARSSTENLPKDHKSGKRRNSFGSTKSDNADQEPRDSSSRSTLPSYMQATESARAKANSPRSSPDVHDKEVYTKKRHSLPGATGKQGSHIHRSTPQPPQSAKAGSSLPSSGNSFSPLK
ncbi:Protein IQ-DOMAIN 32 [Bienertia sinuspersici]